MKKLILLLIPVLMTISADAQTFLKKYTRIHNKGYEDKLELMRIAPEEIIDSLTIVAQTQTGEELAETQRSIQELMNHKEIIVTGFQPNEDVNPEYKKNTDHLLSAYEELIMIRKERFGGKILGKIKKDKISEIIIWLESDLTPPGKIPSFFDFNWNMSFIINIPFIKPVFLEEWLEQSNDGEVENLELNDSFFDSIIGILGIDFDTESSFTMGEWLEENTPAQNCKIRKIGTGEKYGLYDAQKKAILQPEYDEIKNLIGFLRTDSTGYRMYILGFELTKDNKKGYANLDGEIIIPTEYDNLSHFEMGRSRYMRLYKNNKQGLADEITGELIIPIEYDQITWRGPYLELGKGDILYKIDWDNDEEKIIGTEIKLLE